MPRLRINKKLISVPEGATVAAAIVISGESAFRHSISGQPRAPLCGMGICMECCVTIDGLPHQRSCQTLAAEGMEIRTT